MDLTTLLLVFTTLWQMTTSLRCYKCESHFQSYTERLCQHFDYSDQYIVECEQSTICYKRETKSNLADGLKIYERGCAKQTIDGYQERTEEGWKHVTKIYEPYKEGCAANLVNPDRVPSTVLCYCRGDLCNGAVGIPTGGWLVVSLIVGLLHIIRY